MPNRLINETSPYLLQHAHNPVEWYPWGPEALERARAEDKPILLSIGYSACHWCHVMERESFEDEETARLMNENFINIKVDREERPDLDSIYMQAVQAMTHQGGWPLTVFLTPDGAPFYGGTYFPPSDRHGMPSFRRVLHHIATAYRDRRSDVDRSAEGLRTLLSQRQVPGPSSHGLSLTILNRAVVGIAMAYDETYGGFGSAPKFPQPMNLEFLLRAHQGNQDPQTLQMVENTLQRMARGGIYDQLGGGFHRYSTDRQWLIPHFEKMLYDNAQLARIYLEAYQVTGNEFYRRICEETLEYVRREMTSPEGGFYSAQDADSEGEEGKFFVWTPAEVAQALGPEDGRLFCRLYGVTPEGNFQHGTSELHMSASVLHRPLEPEDVAAAERVPVERVREAAERGERLLFERREQRVKPGLDNKCLTAWNGMMLRAYAEAAAVLGRDEYLRLAQANATFLLTHLVRDGRVLRSARDGQARLAGYLEDYANLADGLLALYQADFDTRWFAAARQLGDEILARFWDEEEGAFFDTAADHEQLIARPREATDNAVPSGNSVAVDVLLKLWLFTGEERYREYAERVLDSYADATAQHPNFFGRLLSALWLYLSEPREVAIVGDPASPDTQALLEVVRRPFLPNKVVASRRPGDEAAPQVVPLLADRPMVRGRPTAFVCQGTTCGLPVNDPQALATQLA